MSDAAWAIFVACIGFLGSCVLAVAFSVVKMRERLARVEQRLEDLRNGHFHREDKHE